MIKECEFFSTCTDKCLLPKVTGRCRAYFPRWAYNRVTMKCETFVYGGCGANENNFQSELLCKQSCGGKSDEFNRKISSVKKY